MNLRIALLTIAEEIFRNQADQDYISARAVYRLALREQFLWLGLQACEKYLKGILLFNHRSARYLPGTYDLQTQKRGRGFRNHDLRQLFDAAAEITDLPNYPNWISEFMKYLSTYGNNRYLSISTYATGLELRELDETVWYLRRVCRNFDSMVQLTDSTTRDLRRIEMRSIADPKRRQRPALDRPLGAIDGLLEKVLKRRATDPTRRTLVWNNLFFGVRHRRAVSYTMHSSSENPPQTRDWFQTPAITQQIGFFVKGIP